MISYEKICGIAPNFENTSEILIMLSLNLIEGKGYDSFSWHKLVFPVFVFLVFLAGHYWGSKGAAISKWHCSWRYQILFRLSETW